MEISKTLLDNKTVDVDLTNIFFEDMISVHDLAILANNKYPSGTVAVTNLDHLHWKTKKVNFAIDVSTNDNWYKNGSTGTLAAPGKLAYGNTSWTGGYITYKFTTTDKYNENLALPDPPYHVNKCVTLFYYTDESNSNNYDTSINLLFPPIIYFQTRHDTNNAVINPPAIKRIATSIYSKSVKQYSHPYSQYTYGYNDGYRVGDVTSYSWYDLSGNCDLNYTGLNNNGQATAYNWNSAGSTTAPSFEIGFKKNGLSFLNEDNIKCQSGYQIYRDGWVELDVIVTTQGRISYKNTSYTGSYKTISLKVRIIKIKLLDAGKQQFFIGSKYPNSIYISNPTGGANSLTAVKEVWLGNVKVWPSSYDFDNLGSFTNGHIGLNLEFTKFNFYLTNDLNNRYGPGITQGSVYVSIGYVISEYGKEYNKYDAHLASYQNRISSGEFKGCSIARYLTEPYLHGANKVNTDLKISCGSSKTYYITYDGSNINGIDSKYKHSFCKDSSCKSFFTNIHQFTPIDITLYFCCPKPTVLGGNADYYYDDNGPDGSDLEGSSMSKTRIKVKNKVFSCRDIYKLASKEMMTSSPDAKATIYDGANCANWKTLNGTKIINSYTDASVNSNESCSGYLNTIHLGSHHLGEIAGTTIKTKFVVNVYIAPDIKRPDAQSNPQYIGSNYPKARLDHATRHAHTIIPNGLGGYTISDWEDTAMATTNIYTAADTYTSSWKDGKYISLINYSNKDDLHVGVKVIATSAGSNKYKAELKLFISKSCSTTVVTENGNTLWNGDPTAGLDIIEYQSCAPKSDWDESDYYDIPGSARDYYISRGRSITTGAFCMLDQTQYNSNDGRLYVSIDVTEEWKEVSIPYAVYTTGLQGNISLASVIIYDYVYRDKDYVFVSITQRPITHGANKVLYETTVVSGSVSSYGAFNYGSVGD